MDQTVYYARILTAAENTGSAQMAAHKLTDDGQVQDPRGLAVDGVRGVLYVADPGAKAIVAMRLYESYSGLEADVPKKVLSGIETRWVAVDSAGNLFYTDSNSNAIWSYPVDAVMENLDGGNTSDTEGRGTTTDHRLLQIYDSASAAHVSSPQGIAVAGHKLFWANGINGKMDGSVVEGPSLPPEVDKQTILSKVAVNVDSAYGICITGSRVFYTDTNMNVFSTKIIGGDATTVTDLLVKPRGCAYNGGSIYVADHEDNKIYRFSGASVNLGKRRLMKALHVSNPFGIAVYTGAAPRLGLTVVVALAVGLFDLHR